MLFSEPALAPVLKVVGGDRLNSDQYQFLEIDSTPMDLTEWTFSAHWRKSRNSSDFLAMTVDVSEAATGTLTFSATEAQTLDMKADGWWSIRGVFDGETETFIEGQTSWRLGVTR